MKEFRKYLFVFIGIFILVLSQRFLNPRQHGLTDSIASDGLGYYSYLPAGLIYHDFQYKFYNDPNNHIKPIHHTYFNNYKDKLINKYYCGTAILMLPFFLLGILISFIAGTDINGYTDTFLMLISLASIFYFVLSVFFLNKIANYLKIPQSIMFLVVGFFFFGTNLFHYVVQEPSMSHVYSFFAVTLFFYLFIEFIKKRSNGSLIALALSFSLIALIRPPNVIVILFIPFFFENFKEFISFIKSVFINNIVGILFFILVFVVAIFVQLYFYYLQVGEFFLVTYEGESFNFSKPEFLNSFFSYKKGLFMYTPFYLAAIIFILFTKNSIYKKSIFMLVFSVFSYFTVSWWCWWYGGGFTIRPFVDLLPVFVVCVALFLSSLSGRKLILTSVFFLPFIIFGQLKTYQYSNLLITSLDMDKESYMDFLFDSDLASVNEKRKESILTNGSILIADSIGFEDYQELSQLAFTGYKSTKSFIVGKMNNFSKGLDIYLKDLPVDMPLFIIAECMVKQEVQDNDLKLVISVTNNGNILKWDNSVYSQFSNDDNGWMKMTKVLEIKDKLLHKDNAISVLVHSEKGESYLDNIKYYLVRKVK